MIRDLFSDSISCDLIDSFKFAGRCAGCACLNGGRVLHCEKIHCYVTQRNAVTVGAQTTTCIFITTLESSFQARELSWITSSLFSMCKSLVVAEALRKAVDPIVRTSRLFAQDLSRQRPITSGAKSVTSACEQKLDYNRPSVAHLTIITNAFSCCHL